VKLNVRLPSSSDAYTWLLKFPTYLQDKKVSNIYRPDNSIDSNDGTVIGGVVSEASAADEEAPLIPSARLSYVTRTQTGSLSNR
jgi:hypothetical protein